MRRSWMGWKGLAVAFVATVVLVGAWFTWTALSGPPEGVSRNAPATGAGQTQAASSAGPSGGRAWSPGSALNFGDAGTEGASTGGAGETAGATGSGQEAESAPVSSPAQNALTGNDARILADSLEQGMREMADQYKADLQSQPNDYAGTVDEVEGQVPGFKDRIAPALATLRSDFQALAAEPDAAYDNFRQGMESAVSQYEESVASGADKQQAFEALASTGEQLVDQLQGALDAVDAKAEAATDRFMDALDAAVDGLVDGQAGGTPPPVAL